MFRYLCEATTTQPQGGQIAVYVVLIVILIAMLVLPYFSQRKKSREYEAMLNSINVGDLVKTAGGIIGRVKNITDKGEIKTVVLETGSKTDKSFVEFDMNMIYCVLKSTKTAQTTENDDLDDEEELEETVEVKNDETANEETKAEEVTETSVEEEKETKDEKKSEDKENKETSNNQKKPIQKKSNSSKKKK